MTEHITVKLVSTCGACPEQYDAYINGEKVGYLRLRHGVFRVECPSSGGDTVFMAHPHGDGCFDSDERDRYLIVAASRIRNWYSRRNEKPIPEYEIVDAADI